MQSFHNNLYRYSTYPTKHQSSRKKYFLLALFVIVIFICGLFTWQFVLGKSRQDDIRSASSSSAVMWQKINKSLDDLISSRPDLEISVSVIDINNNIQKDYGISDSFEGASTTKVLSAIVFLHEVENNEQNLDEQLGDFSARYQLCQMINQSDNDSWEAVNQQLGHDELSAYAKSIGLSSYNPDDNLITAHDEAILLDRLYQGKLLNDSNTKLLLSWMQNTNDESMIPSVIPEGATVYHKYGALDDRLHDVAIVVYKNQQVVLSIYTKSTNGTDTDYDNRTIFIKKLASNVLENFLHY